MGGTRPTRHDAAVDDIARAWQKSARRGNEGGQCAEVVRAAGSSPSATARHWMAG